jgi:Transglycosylase-like domain
MVCHAAQMKSKRTLLSLAAAAVTLPAGAAAVLFAVNSGLAAPAASDALALSLHRQAVAASKAGLADRRSLSAAKTVPARAQLTAENARLDAIARAQHAAHLQRLAHHTAHLMHERVLARRAAAARAAAAAAAATPAPPQQPAAAPAPAQPVSGGSVNWYAIAQCESGGNWAADTGNGFYGGLQFTLSTWDAYGGQQYAAMPNEASASAQIAIAEKVLAGEGIGAWPVCGANG